jgi:hypothetical protein
MSGAAEASTSHQVESQQAGLRTEMLDALYARAQGHWRLFLDATCRGDTAEADAQTAQHASWCDAFLAAHAARAEGSAG